MLSRLTLTRTVHTLPIMAALAVSFVTLFTPLGAQQCPPPTDSTATVLELHGDVSALLDASGYRTALNPCKSVKPQQVIRTGIDGYAKFQVSDGSTFEVFPNSEVVFRKTYSIGDLLNVWLGRVKVYIQHLPGIPNPNNVTTPTALISVRGTVFDVDVEDLDGTTFVSLDEGMVEVRHLRVASPTVRLSPGQSVRVIPNQPLAPLGMDRGNLFRQLLKGAQEAARQVAYGRAGGGNPGSPGSGTAGTTTGAQGDKGKNTGNAPGTGTSAPTAGAPTGAPSGAPPAAPPPPPPAGGGGD